MHLLHSSFPPRAVSQPHPNNNPDSSTTGLQTGRRVGCVESSTTHRFAWPSHDPRWRPGDAYELDVCHRKLDTRYGTFPRTRVEKQELAASLFPAPSLFPAHPSGSSCPARHTHLPWFRSRPRGIARPAPLPSAPFSCVLPAEGYSSDKVRYPNQGGPGHPPLDAVRIVTYQGGIGYRRTRRA